MEITNMFVFANMFIILPVLMLLSESEGLQCSSEGDPCCAGTWNEIQKKCDDGCQLGYFGRICNQKCRFPNYGYLCQQQCNCSESTCHYKDGCLRGENKSAKECNPGFYGKNCSIPCRYPSFGQLCQKLCECSKKSCDHVRGCVQREGCTIGFIGNDCSEICPYPTYGKNCKELCKCGERYCDVVTGCSSEYGCRPGYFGFRCVYKCRYPNFGKFCQIRCNCSEDQCDHVLGCREDIEKKGLSVTNEVESEKTASVAVPITLLLSVILVFLGALIWFYRFKIQKWCNKKSDDILMHNEEVSPTQTNSYIETANQERESCRYFSSLHVNRQNPNSGTRNMQNPLDVSNLYEAVEYPAPDADDTRSAPYPMVSFISVYSGDDTEILTPIDE